jgi:hypothetical protein
MKCDGRIINCYWLIGVVPAVVEVEVATKNTKCTNSGSYQKIDRRSMLIDLESPKSVTCLIFVLGI